MIPSAKPKKGMLSKIVNLFKAKSPTNKVAKKKPVQKKRVQPKNTRHSNKNKRFDNKGKNTPKGSIKKENHQKNKKPFEKKQNAKVIEKKTNKIEEKITPRKLSRPKKVESTKQEEKTIAPRRTGERASNDPRNKN